MNVPFQPIDNVDGRQAAFMFAPPGYELFQQLAALYEIGQSYHLTVGIVGGGYGMPAGTPMEIRLYYLDAGSNRVTAGATVVTNTNTTGNLTHLTDYTLDLPAVTAGDAWAGKAIGIQLISTADFSNAQGYWDIDNVRLTSAPEPASMALTLVGAGALWVRRRYAARS